MMKQDLPLLPMHSTSRKDRHSCCVVSKAARLILLWNFSVLLVYNFFYGFNSYIQVGYLSIAPIIMTVSFSFVTVISPIAGLLTDVKFSRFLAVLRTTYFIEAKILAIFVVLLLLSILWICGHLPVQSYHTKRIVYATVPTLFMGMIVLYTIFIINAFSFGMDQLHDSSTEDSILYIHWYVWIVYACSLITEIAWNFVLHDVTYLEYIDGLRFAGLSLTVFIFIITLLLLTFSLWVVYYKKVWFLFEPAGVNPYKLVYRVVKFAYQHKVPLRRSAFTYCDEESQTRLDVGKHKYGGPFTTKQVEDVKAFWGILKVLISIGPAFLLQTVMQTILPAFAKHGNVFVHKINASYQEVHIEEMAQYILISNGLLSPLLVVICIPLYLYWIRPRIKYYIPGILNRIQLGILVMLASLICTFVMDVVVHQKNTELTNCMFTGYARFSVSANIFYDIDFPTSPLLFQNIYFFTTQHVLSALADMLLDIAVLEFVCSQSPYSMKGLLLGIFFSIRSLFQGITFLSILPFVNWKIESLSCGSGFYAMAIVVGLLEFVIFLCVSKRYKYRNMNEPSNEYRYAEEYYSNIQ